MGVPTMYTRLLRHLETHPDDAPILARARLFTAGSAALPAEDLRRFQALTGHRIVERYGMTETLITLSNPLHGERRPGSVGLPLPGVQVRVVDDDGTPVPDGDPGELQVQGPGLMTGYRGRPDDTAAVFDGPWFRTGDVVVRESDGYLRIVGRRSVDIIKSGGFKIGAREIEDVLATHPLVAEVAVFGVPDPEWGEAITAAVVPTCDVTEPELLAALQAHCAGALVDYKKPRRVLVLPELPRNAMGKVMKTELKDGLAVLGVDERTR
jgi:acyl-CoA synthetase (AMP-forming)/AMP-acid ligase II